MMPKTQTKEIWRDGKIKTVFEKAFINLKGEVVNADQKLIQERTNQISKAIHKFEQRSLMSTPSLILAL